MATPAELLAAAGTAAATPRRAVARPMTATVGTAPGGVETMEAGGAESAMMPDTAETLRSLPGFKPMGGMPAPPTSPTMAQGREVVEQGGQQGVVGDGGRFQPLGQAALSKLNPGGTFGGGSGGIIADEAKPDIRPMPMLGFRAMPASPYRRQPGGGRTDVGGGKLRAMMADGQADVSPTEEQRARFAGYEQGGSDPSARGMSSIGAAVGRAMRPRPMRSAVSREGAAPGY